MKILAKIAENVEPFAAARIAAALVYKNEVISVGWNKSKSHPFQKKYSSNSEAIFLHAETDTIYNAMRKYDLSVIAKSKLYIYRAKWNSDKKISFVQGLAKPCVGCMRAITTFNIKRICYTLDETGFGCF